LISSVFLTAFFKFRPDFTSSRAVADGIWRVSRDGVTKFANVSIMLIVIAIVDGGG